MDSTEAVERMKEEKDNLSLTVTGLVEDVLILKRQVRDAAERIDGCARDARVSKLEEDVSAHVQEFRRSDMTFSDTNSEFRRRIEELEGEISRITGRLRDAARDLDRAPKQMNAKQAAHYLANHRDATLTDNQGRRWRGGRDGGKR